MSELPRMNSVNRFARREDADRFGQTVCSRTIRPLCAHKNEEPAHAPGSSNARLAPCRAFGIRFVLREEHSYFGTLSPIMASKLLSKRYGHIIRNIEQSAY